MTSMSTGPDINKPTRRSLRHSNTLRCIDQIQPCWTATQMSETA